MLVGLFVVGAVVAGAVLWRGHDPSRRRGPHRAASHYAGRAAAAQAARGHGEAGSAPAPAGDDADQAARRRRRTSQAAEKTSSKPKPALSAEVARELAGAEAALAAGNFSEAIRLAQHSLYTQQTSEAYGLIVRARCAQGDIGNAKAALTKVAARDRAAVVRACGKLGVEIR